MGFGPDPPIVMLRGLLPSHFSTSFQGKYDHGHVHLRQGHVLVGLGDKNMTCLAR